MWLPDEVVGLLLVATAKSIKAAEDCRQTTDRALAVIEKLKETVALYERIVKRYKALLE